MAFCCASEYGNAFGSGGVWGAGGVIAANRDTCFDAGSLEGAALGFLPGFWASGRASSKEEERYLPVTNCLRSSSENTLTTPYSPSKPASLMTSPRRIRATASPRASQC